VNFLTLDQAQRQPYLRQYRYSPVLAAAGFVAAASAGVACVWAGADTWHSGSLAVSGILFWVALWAVLFALLLFRMLRRRLLSSNWLVRTHRAGVLIKFRSYLNGHLDPNDAVVVDIGYHEMESVRGHRVRQDVAGGARGGAETRYLRFAEFRLRRTKDLEALSDRLKAERSRKAPMAGRFIRRSSKDADYPAQVVGETLRVEWHVWPRLSTLLTELRSQVMVQDSVSSEENFTTLGTATSDEQQDAVLRLAAQGDLISAIRIVRQLYGYNMTQAIQFLDELVKPAGK